MNEDWKLRETWWGRICDKVKKKWEKMELLDVGFGKNYGTTGEIVGKL